MVVSNSLSAENGRVWKETYDLSSRLAVEQRRPWVRVDPVEGNLGPGSSWPSDDSFVVTWSPDWRVTHIGGGPAVAYKAKVVLNDRPSSIAEARGFDVLSAVLSEGEVRSLGPSSFLDVPSRVEFDLNAKTGIRRDSTLYLWTSLRSKFAHVCVIMWPTSGPEVYYCEQVFRLYVSIGELTVTREATPWVQIERGGWFHGTIDKGTVVLDRD
jgi:hypothetical protein